MNIEKNMSVEEIEKLAIEAYHDRTRRYDENEKVWRKERQQKAFLDLKGRLPGITMDEESYGLWFAGRKCNIVQNGTYYPGGQEAYSLEIERGEHVSSLASFGEYLLRKNNGKRD